MSSTQTETRRRILDAAWRLLEGGDGDGVAQDQGGDGRGDGARDGRPAERRPTRMADIAREAGISRQAVYLHFPTRTELLIATTRRIDEVKRIDARLAASRQAEGGLERLDAFIAAWGSYMPEIAGVARALLAVEADDAAARAAWADRMAAVRHGCAATVRALAEDGRLKPGYDPEMATDILAALLSFHTWAQLTGPAGWSQATYLATMKRLARDALTAEA